MVIGLAGTQIWAGDVASDIRALTGAHTRLVWCQAVDNPGDRFAGGDGFRLCGFDTEDNAGERRIVPEISSYSKPLLTTDGSRIIFSNRVDKYVYVVDWDGAGLRKLVKGFASDVWADPKTGIEWVYVRTGDGSSTNPVFRYQIDNPKAGEMVWNKGPTGHQKVPWFQVSADGTRAGGAFPWSNCGVAILPNRSWKKYGAGCWTSLAPDNSYRFFLFNGGHKTITVFDRDGVNRRLVKVNGAANVAGRDVYHPWWSGDVRFLTVTGPGLDGHQVELYIGKFNGDFTAVEQWARVTHNNKGDFYGDAWVSPSKHHPTAEARKAKPEQLIVKPPSAEEVAKYKTWPGNTAGLIFLWETNDKTNQIILPDGAAGRSCRVEPRGYAKYDRHFAMDLAGGAFFAEDVDRNLLDACRRTDQLTIEAAITPAGLKQVGPARIVSFSSDTGSRNFTLGQQNDKLIFRLRTPRTGDNGANPEIELCELEAGKLQHVIVTYMRGLLACYLNGEQVLVTNKVQGDLSNWAPHHLIFGDEFSGGRDWAGSLEGIAIHSRFIDLPEAEKRYELYTARLKTRKSAARLVVQARLARTTPTPAPKAIAPYRRCLAVYEYDVEKVVTGDYRKKKLHVAHWVILDAKVLPVSRRKGKSYRLTLERFDDNPQLQAERRADDIDEFDLPLYYDVGGGRMNDPQITQITQIGEGPLDNRTMRQSDNGPIFLTSDFGPWTVRLND